MMNLPLHALGDAVAGTTSFSSTAPRGGYASAATAVKGNGGLIISSRGATKRPSRKECRPAMVARCPFFSRRNGP